MAGLSKSWNEVCSQEEEARIRLRLCLWPLSLMPLSWGSHPACNPQAHRLAAKPKAKPPLGAPGAVRITKNKFVCVCVHVQVTGNGKTKPRNPIASWPQRRRRSHLNTSTQKAIKTILLNKLLLNTASVQVAFGIYNFIFST